MVNCWTAKSPLLLPWIYNNAYMYFINRCCEYLRMITATWSNISSAAGVWCTRNELLRAWEDVQEKMLSADQISCLVSIPSPVIHSPFPFSNKTVHGIGLSKSQICLMAWIVVRDSSPTLGLCCELRLNGMLQDSFGCQVLFNPGEMLPTTEW